MFLQIPEADKALLKRYLSKWKLIAAAIMKNQQLLDDIVLSQEDWFAGRAFQRLSDEERVRIIANEDTDERGEVVKKIEKVRSMLSHLYRDWSSEGARERAECYDPILGDLDRLYPSTKGDVKVLVPGAGLGRLAYDIAAKGFITEGNKISYNIQLTSGYVLTELKRIGECHIFSWVTETNNVLRSDDYLQVVAIHSV